MSTSDAGSGAGGRFHRRFTVCGGTHVKERGTQNQDTFVIANLESGRISRPCIRTEVWVARPGVLMLVCGGEPPAGELAAQLAASSIKHGLEAEGENVGKAPFFSLKRAIQGANQALIAEGEAHPDEPEMTTTCAAAIVAPDRLTLARVGDARAYLLRAGSLHLLTAVEPSEPETAGGDERTALGSDRRPAATAAAAGPDLTSALGADIQVRPEMTSVALQEGDRVLLCSSGLHRTVSDQAIQSILAGTRDVAEVSETLLQAAAAYARSSDDVTVVIADCGPMNANSMNPD